MKIVSIVGARPQFIKAGPVSKALRARHTEVLVHTGQHYDYEMSKVFFEGLNLPEPNYNLDVGSGLHGEQTGKMLAGIEQIAMREKPDAVLIYGDTNSTLAGALAAAKLNIPVAHVEAGLRSFNRTMPEEINRIVADHVSRWLFCPTPTSVENLKHEGIVRGVHLVGDVMFDAAIESAQAAEAQSRVLDELGLAKQGYALVTVHRASNTDDPANLRNIVEALIEMGGRVVFPVHPRTQKYLELHGLAEKLAAAPGVSLIPPQSFLDFVMLQKHAARILTDSGGVQKEARFHCVPCITLREETEWVETLEDGWNVLAGADKSRILAAAAGPGPDPATAGAPLPLWDGRVSERIAEILAE